MIVIEWIVRVLIHTVFGWVGHITVKAVTLGRVELPTGDSSESVITECIGAGVLLALAMLLALAIGLR